MKKKLLATLLSFAMLFSLLPVSALAANATTVEQPEVELLENETDDAPGTSDFTALGIQFNYDKSTKKGTITVDGVKLLAAANADSDAHDSFEKLLHTENAAYVGLKFKTPSEAKSSNATKATLTVNLGAEEKINGEEVTLAGNDGENLHDHEAVVYFRIADRTGNTAPWKLLPNTDPYKVKVVWSDNNAEANTWTAEDIEIAWEFVATDYSVASAGYIDNPLVDTAGARTVTLAKPEKNLKPLSGSGKDWIAETMYVVFKKGIPEGMYGVAEISGKNNETDVDTLLYIEGDGERNAMAWSFDHQIKGVYNPHAGDYSMKVALTNDITVESAESLSELYNVILLGDYTVAVPETFSPGVIEERPAKVNESDTINWRDLYATAGITAINNGKVQIDSSKLTVKTNVDDNLINNGWVYYGVGYQTPTLKGGAEHEIKNAIFCYDGDKKVTIALNTEKVTVDAATGLANVKGTLVDYIPIAQVDGDTITAAFGGIDDDHPYTAQIMWTGDDTDNVIAITSVSITFEDTYNPPAPPAEDKELSGTLNAPVVALNTTSKNTIDITKVSYVPTQDETTAGVSASVEYAVYKVEGDSSIAKTPIIGWTTNTNSIATQTLGAGSYVVYAKASAAGYKDKVSDASEKVTIEDTDPGTGGDPGEGEDPGDEPPTPAVGTVSAPGVTVVENNKLKISTVSTYSIEDDTVTISYYCVKSGSNTEIPFELQNDAYVTAALDNGTYTVYAKATDAKTSKLSEGVEKTISYDPGDTTAPTLKFVGEVTPAIKSAELQIQSTETGKYYYVLSTTVLHNDTEGWVKTDDTAESGDLTADTAAKLTFKALEAATTYYLYIVAEDGSGNLSKVLSTSFDTLPVPTTDTTDTPEVAKADQTLGKDATTVEFTISNYAEANTYQLYDSNKKPVDGSKYEVAATGTLTITTGELGYVTSYYLSATAPEENESTMLRLTVSPYVKQNVTVSFAAGNHGNGAMSSVEVQEDSEYTLPVCGFTAAEGYGFKAWSGDVGDGVKEYAAGTTVTVTQATEFTAVWVEENLKITEVLEKAVEGAKGTGTKSSPEDLKIVFTSNDATVPTEIKGTDITADAGVDVALYEAPDFQTAKESISLPSGETTSVYVTVTHKTTQNVAYYRVKVTTPAKEIAVTTEKATTDGGKTATATIAASASTAIDDAGEGDVLTLDAKAASNGENVTKAEVTIKKDTAETIESKGANAQITTDVGTVTLPAAAFTEVKQSATDSEHTATITKVSLVLEEKKETADINTFKNDVDNSDANKDKVTKVFDVSMELRADDGTKKDDVKMESLSTVITLTFNIGTGKDKNEVKLAYLDANRKLRNIRESVYDPETGILTAKTDHLTKFVLLENPEEIADPSIESVAMNSKGDVTIQVKDTDLGNKLYLESQKGTGEYAVYITSGASFNSAGEAKTASSGDTLIAILGNGSDVPGTPGSAGEGDLDFTLWSYKNYAQ